MESHVPLNRQFSPVPKSQEEAEENEILSILDHGKQKTWNDIYCEYRCVILAEAGAGKTEEFRQRAKDLATQGKPSFFIRIEDIEADFYKAFEIGAENLFQSWLQSMEEAWFFLDSVDEARLENPRTFEKALRRFATVIKKGAHRAHIYLSSRPYAWRPTEDRRLFDDLLFLAAQPISDGSEKDVDTQPQSALALYTMCPLDEERIRRFCEARTAKEVDRLLWEIERDNLWSLAERPFDLEGILAKWNKDNKLGGRLELLRHNIEDRLHDNHNIDRAQRQPLNIERAHQGASRLAAAVILTGMPGLNVPDIMSVKPGIEAETILADWNPKDVRALLERGIFNDIIYSAVRFRHRDVHELLAAEWFSELLKDGNSRSDVEKLFFRDQYGEIIIAPRLRSILPWLILFDDEICRRALAIHPEIAVEGGDPSRLPLPIRQKILSDIVRRIVSNEDDRSARDNSAIARIANQDLAGDTKQLIDEFSDNDDAIFFLGRLVWQGGMVNCVTPFVDITADNTRGIYARIASARAIMTCGSDEQKQLLWDNLNENNDPVPRKLLAELIEKVEPDGNNVAQLIISLSKLPPYERFKSTGLGRALHKYVESLPIVSDHRVINLFLDGLYSYLNRQPYVERRECHVSKEYAWLLSPATHAVERLVEERSSIVFGMTALSIMLNVPALRFWRDTDFSEYEGNLKVLVPAWPELNDALYWTSIERARATKIANSDEPLTDDWSVSCLGHFWLFDTASLPRLLKYIRSRTLQDDRLVALSTAFRVYVQADRPEYILTNLENAVADDSALRHQLNMLLNPPVSEVMREHEQKMEERKQERNKKKEQQKKNREIWIEGLRTDPDRVRNSPNLKPGEFTSDQYWLMIELQDSNSATGRSDYANWQALIPDFGDAVARAYRDAAISHWWHYEPTLQSEGVKRDNSTPYSLIFAMAGLEIEAAEVDEFPANMNEVQARLALRYITWELNGFPGWFERVYHRFPTLTKEAVLKELLWELENTEADNPTHYILSDLTYHAPWLHAEITPAILKWVEDNLTSINTNIRHCIHILINGGTDPIRIASLAKQQMENINDADSIAVWHALHVDCDPMHGIPELGQWLAVLDDETATHSAQIFITTLIGGRRSDGYPQVGRYRTAKHLKTLYLLMHRYIRTKEDIDRSGGGVYSPELRDDAQDARNRLFGLLSEKPGKESYLVIKQLAHDHPDPDYRPWMTKQMYRRAEEDGDLEPWTAKQVSAFAQTQTLTPATHRQLFDLAVSRLQDLKNWLECGNDSAWQTWKRASSETEMRTLIAGWLNQRCRHQYTTAQEPELANSQRMDIWLHNTNVPSPVPIELKLLDKGWSGPKLCERLRNQLVGDYLREDSAGCGVMLLVWQGNKPEKRWMVNGRSTDLSELACALKNYWQEDIADQFPGVEAIDVIVIDLTQRGQISNT